MFVELSLITVLGFLGSFGHCAGMCGPLVLAFSLGRNTSQTWIQRLRFQLLLNGGRLLSYALVGAAVGGLGSVLVAGGSLAGMGSPLRQTMTILTGGLLVVMGLTRMAPSQSPRLSFWHPLKAWGLQERLHLALNQLSQQPHWWTPAALGMAWGLIPCGFLCTAQLKAADAGDLWQGGLIMLAFGVGTVPAMVGLGISLASISADQRSQLSRAGGWLTLLIGVLTILRTDAMQDLSGHAALLLLMLALLARPLRRLWAPLLQYRRLLGVSAFVLAMAHTVHMLEHSLDWNLDGISFMVPQHRLGLWCGILALLLLTPAVLTSFDQAQVRLGRWWRRIHLLSLPALLLVGGHTLLLGSHYGGNLDLSSGELLACIALAGGILGVLLIRSRQFWSWLFLESWYGASAQRWNHASQSLPTVSGSCCRGPHDPDG